MAYDERLANRIRSLLGGNISEKKMFGGLAFMLRDKMFCGVVNDDLVARVGPEDYQRALRQPHVRPMDFTGKPMRGYVFVSSIALESDDQLREWLERAQDFTASLPSPKRKRPIFRVGRGGPRERHGHAG